MFYLFGEDFAPGMIGPFNDRQAAEAHLELWKLYLGEDAVSSNHKIIHESEIKGNEKFEWTMQNNLSTPEEDKKYLESLKEFTDETS